MSDILAGYRIVRPLGVGAGSQIVLATQIKTGLSFAIKRVRRNTPEDERFFRQVEIEYQVGSRVLHPNLRRCIDLRRKRHLLRTIEMALILEYVDGLPLVQALPNRMMTFLGIFQRVAAALQALHQAGYVHSDIKPNNIMIAKRGVVKVIDLGQACRIGQRKERIQGTADYIAPEQVRRLELTERTDIFNLGATMYWVLTKLTYPTELSELETGAVRRPREAAPAPIDVNPKLPLALSNLVMECCKDNPLERPGNMVKFSERLTAIQQVWQKQVGRSKTTASRTESSTFQELSGAIGENIPAAATDAGLVDSGEEPFGKIDDPAGQVDDADVYDQGMEMRGDETRGEDDDRA